MLIWASFWLGYILLSVLSELEERPHPYINPTYRKRKDWYLKLYLDVHLKIHMKATSSGGLGLFGGPFWGAFAD